MKPIIRSPNSTTYFRAYITNCKTRYSQLLPFAIETIRLFRTPSIEGHSVCRKFFREFGALSYPRSAISGPPLGWYARTSARPMLCPRLPPELRGHPALARRAVRSRCLEHLRAGARAQGAPIAFSSVQGERQKSDPTKSVALRDLQWTETSSSPGL